MKYKLLKEYPWVETGCIGELQIGYNRYKFIGVNHSVYIDRDVVENNPDWFEPVIERWRADKDKEYFYFDACGVSGDDEQNHGSDKERFEFGNYFKTRDQAEEASKRIKQTLMDYHKELGE